MLKFLLLILIIFICLIEAKKSAIEHDYLEEKGVKKDIKNQILSMSQSGMTHEKITSHLKQFHLKDKSEAELNDIVMATHIQAGKRHPRHTEGKPRTMKKIKEKKTNKYGNR